jgi:DNA helicase-2/ATP-dependent DNA helicase PcrA
VSDFTSQYQKLNPEQKIAVDTLEGPVLVIAGAGTGKTQTIALRIGKILKETQVNSHNILCLTFTDNAALNMRQRLLDLIGPASYGVRICTFHAFCNSVIKDHPEYFLFSSRESIPLDDIKQIQIVRELIDKLPPQSPLKSFNFTYFFQKDIIRALGSLKKENITPEKFKQLIKLASDFVKISAPVAQNLAAIRAVPKAEKEIVSLSYQLAQAVSPLYQSRINLSLDLFNKQVITLADLKRNIRDLVEKTSYNLPKLQDLLIVYHNYERALVSQGLYDYDDMILWAVGAFKKNPSLLSDYQELYQYLLVDEFQDTNSSQYEIINQLIQSQPLPNIFVVGDDDQSIYRFQGASVENVFTFYQRFKKDLKIIVLKNNYRSHKLILDVSGDVISHNQNRITSYIDSIDKSLISARTFDPDPINLFAADTGTGESFFVADRIKKLITAGTKPSEIAVLYRNNADINDLLPYLQLNHTKYLISDAVNILDTPEIQQLLTLFRYIFNPDDVSLYAQVLSFKFININSLTLYKIFHRQIDPDKLKSIRKLRRNLAYIDKLKYNAPADLVFNRVIRRFGYLDWILKHHRIDLLKQVNTLYSHLKNNLQIDRITLSQWVDGLQILVDSDLNLNSPPLLGDQDLSIRLMTVHKAKGLEFEHVFLYKVLSGKWDSATSRNLIKLPLGIVSTDISKVVYDSDTEEDRRLFYVALTRAKNQIYLSYSRLNDAGKEQLHSIFINEIDPKRIQNISSTPKSESAALLTLYSPKIPELISVSLKGYLNDYLTTRYRFNVTHLNSYLKCPLCFFFKTILHLPQVKTKSLSFGTSVHGALAYLYQHRLSLEKFIDIFVNNLKKENLTDKDRRDLLASGKIIMADYYTHYKAEFNNKCLIEHDFKDYNARLGDIPLTGKIDKMEFLDKNFVNVVDYKTGKPDSKYQELSADGDYFRQLVFYKILCGHAHGFKYKVRSGTIDFVQSNSKGQYVRKNFELTSADETKLTTQIKDVYKKILAQDFSVGSNCTDPDHLHYLFDKYFK